MNTNAERNEKIFEAMLKTAFEEVVEEEMKALPSLEELEKTCPRSPELDKRMYKLITEKERVAKRERIYKVIIRSAAVLCILFAVATLAIFSVEASRNFIFNTLYNMRSDHVEIGFGNADTEETVANDISYNITLALIQEGFEYTSSNVMGDIAATIFTNLNNEQVFFRQNASATLNLLIDNENRVFESINVNNTDVFIFDAHDSTYRNEVLWSDDNTFFSLSSAYDFDINTLVYIAKKALK